jgi:hypothetical protein
VIRRLRVGERLRRGDGLLAGEELQVEPR